MLRTVDDENKITLRTSHQRYGSTIGQQFFDSLRNAIYPSFRSLPLKFVKLIQKVTEILVLFKVVAENIVAFNVVTKVAKEFLLLTVDGLEGCKLLIEVSNQGFLASRKILKGSNDYLLASDNIYA